MNSFCFLLFAALFLSVSSASIAAPAGSPPGLQEQLEALAQRARPGLLGLAVLDPQSGAEWSVQADRRYPMMSVFKAPLAATVLARVDRGSLSLDQTVTLHRSDLRTGRSALASRFRGSSMSLTVRDLLADAVSLSDNTAADALVRLVGGPEAVTAFLQAHGIHGMSVELDEGGVSRIFRHLGPANRPPPGETPAETARRLREGYAAYLADPRNRSTPKAAVLFLAQLAAGRLLPPASTQHLLHLMEAQQTPRRIRAGLPAGIRWAGKSGTSDSLDGLTAAYNDIGILTWPDGHRVIVAAFLTASPASSAERDALFAELGRDLAAAFPSR